MAYKYQLTTDWPLNGGRTLLVAGTQIDTNLSKWAFLPLSGLPPRGASPLDQTTYDAMVAAYGYWAVVPGAASITPATAASSNPLKCGVSVNSLSCAL